ncbi:conserved protein of unknown function [Bradyrhizobium sp. ORS 285]|nr:conserved hypothetical protein [Bradyrhizobium sp. ORS 285]SMX55671.1 conserved protein of unknown function [Bradyrhizobium sp. ORS 285]
MMSENDRKALDAGPQERDEPRGSHGSAATKPGAQDSLPPAGPHARPDLIDKDKTPGTGMLPDPDDSNPSPTG